MRQIHKAIAVAFVALAMSGYTIRETKSNTDLDLYTSPGGTPAKAVSVSGTTGGLTLGSPDATPAAVKDGALNLYGDAADEYLLNITGITSQPSIYLNRANGTEGTPTIPSSGNEFGRVGFAAFDGTNWQDGARVIGKVDGTPGTADMPGRLEFYTTPDGSATPAERMRIENDGSVSITETGGNGGNVVHGCTRRTNTQNTVAAGTVTCSAGEIVLGGGCDQSGATKLIYAYIGSGSTQFLCGFDASTNITSIAMCCQY